MQVTREELYRLVSDRPLSKVAPDFGISATALALVCRAHDIPYPGSGYWTKKALGMPLVLAPLPLVEAGLPIEIIRQTKTKLGRSHPPVANGPSVAQNYVEQAVPSPSVVVRDRLVKPHQLIAEWLRIHEERTKKAAKSRDPWEVRMAPPAWTAVDHRRHRILDALFKAVEARGGTISEGQKGALQATISAEKIEFQVREKARQIKIPRGDNRSSYLSTELVGTGSLVFAIRTYLRGPHNEEWRESDKRPLETQLPDIVNRLFEGAEILKAWQIERNAEEQRWRQEREKRAEIDRLRRQNEARQTELVLLSGRWETAATLKRYLGALATSHEPDGNIGDMSLAEWTAWAWAYVSELEAQTGTAEALFSAINSVTTTH